MCYSPQAQIPRWAEGRSEVGQEAQPGAKGLSKPRLFGSFQSFKVTLVPLLLKSSGDPHLGPFSPWCLTPGALVQRPSQ